MAKDKKSYKYQKKCEACDVSLTFEKASDFRRKKFCEPCYKKIEQDKKKEKIEEELKKTPKPKLNYRYSLMKINKRTLPKFIFPENRRKITASQIASLKRALYDNTHFDSPLVLNQKEGLFRVIDGNHRIQTIKDIISRHPRFSIDVLAITYKNKDDDEEISLFRRWNTGKVQSLDDFLQSIASKTEFIRWLKSDFPIKVTIYKQKDSINVRGICSAYLAAKNNDDTGYGLKRDNFGNDLKELDEEDLSKMKKMVVAFKDVFGEPNTKNPYYKATFISALFYVIYDVTLDDILLTKLREKVMGDEEILEFASYGGREANRKMIRLIKDKAKIKSKLRLD